MRRYAFLRGMNLGGRRVKNQELIEAFERAGTTDVQAYQAAGNLVFTGPIGADALAAHLERTFGYPVPVLLRSQEELWEVVGGSPFSEEEVGRSGKVQVSLLGEPPGAEAHAQVEALATAADRLLLTGRTLYWLPAGRLTDSSLDVGRIERLLGLQTRRTLGTLERMLKRFG